MYPVHRLNFKWTSRMLMLTKLYQHLSFHFILWIVPIIFGADHPIPFAVVWWRIAKVWNYFCFSFLSFFNCFLQLQHRSLKTVSTDIRHLVFTRLKSGCKKDWTFFGSDYLAKLSALPLSDYSMKCETSLLSPHPHPQALSYCSKLWLNQEVWRSMPK